MASKRRIKRKACGSKVRHIDQQAALCAAHILRRTGTRFINVYHCKWCNGWHVGHMPGNLRRFIK